MTVADDVLLAFAHGMIGAVLDRLCVPFIILDENARIVVVNAMSEAILEDGRHIRRHDLGGLICQSAVSEAVIRRFLSELAQAPDADVDVLIHGRPGEAPLFGSLSTFQPPQFDGFPKLPPVAVVFIRAGYEEEGIEVARMLYTLSDAEAGAVRAVVAGTSLKRHAESRNVSIHTARKQLNAAMRKTGVSSQLQLQTLIGDLIRGPAQQLA